MVPLQTLIVLTNPGAVAHQIARPRRSMRLPHPLPSPASSLGRFASYWRKHCAKGNANLNGETGKVSSDSRTCRNCGNSEFYTKEINPADGAALLPLGVLHGPKYQICICGSCGLTEWFVPKRFLPLVKEQFDPLIR